RASFRDRKDVMVLQPNNDFFKYMRSPNGGSSSAAPAAQTGRHR
ncbi:MAG: protease modulator HflC, partial [Actinobacteria bacterium]|nr:protease modulator HflC [Actinomycetota bacterium]